MPDDLRPEEFEIPDRFRDVSADTRSCPQCGKDLHEDADFCPHCRHWFPQGSGRPASKWLILIVLLMIALLFVGLVLGVLG